MAGSAVSGQWTGRFARISGFQVATDAIVVIYLHVRFGVAIRCPFELEDKKILFLKMAGGAIFFALQSFSMAIMKELDRLHLFTPRDGWQVDPDDIGSIGLRPGITADTGQADRC